VIALPLVFLPRHEYVGFFEVWSAEGEQIFARADTNNALKYRTHYVLHLRLDSHDLPVVIPTRQVQANDSMKREEGNYRMV